MTGSASPLSPASPRRWLRGAAAALLLVATGAGPAPLAFVGSNVTKKLSVIDTGNDTVIRSLPLGYSGKGIAAGADRHVAVYGEAVPRDTNVIILDIDNGRRTAKSVSGPPGVIAAAPDRRRMYIGSEGLVQAIDVASVAVVARFERPLFAASALAAAPDGRTLAVGDSGQGGVLLLDAVTLKPVGRIVAPSTPGGVAWAPSGATLYAVDRDADNVTVIDAVKRQVVRRIAIGRGALALAVGHDGRRLYVTTTGVGMLEGDPQRPGSLVVVDLATGRVVARVAVGQRPIAVALTPDETKAYVVNGGSGTVSVIATRTNRVVATLAVGGDPVAGSDFIAPVEPARR